MIACPAYSSKVYYRTDSTASSVDYYTSSTTVYIASDGWQEVSSEAVVNSEVKFKEPAQEQDEPNAGERPVYCEKPYRRLATVTTSRDRPRQLESTFG